MKPSVIDLSHHNTVSSLIPVKSAGVVAVIHKATEGSSYEDSKCAARRSLAGEAGLKWGLYHFLRPGNIPGQIENFLDALSKFGDANTLLAADHEDDGVSLSALQQWLEGVEKATGRVPVIYSGHVLKEQLGGKRHPVLNGDRYLLWLAQYSAAPTLPAGWDDYWIWQYTDKGKIAGVSGNVDLNQAGDVFDIARWPYHTFPAENPKPPVTEPGIETDIGGVRAWLFEGKRVARKGWNGKGMYLELQKPDANSKMTLPFVYMKTADNNLVPWLCSQTDFCATDWVLA